MRRRKWSHAQAACSVSSAVLHAAKPCVCVCVSIFFPYAHFKNAISSPNPVLPPDTTHTHTLENDSALALQSRPSHIKRHSCWNILQFLFPRPEPHFLNSAVCYTGRNHGVGFTLVRAFNALARFWRWTGFVPPRRP